MTDTVDKADAGLIDELDDSMERLSEIGAEEDSGCVPAQQGDGGHREPS